MLKNNQKTASQSLNCCARFKLNKFAYRTRAVVCNCLYLSLEHSIFLEIANLTSITIYIRVVSFDIEIRNKIFFLCFLFCFSSASTHPVIFSSLSLTGFQSFSQFISTYCYLFIFSMNFYFVAFFLPSDI